MAFCKGTPNIGDAAGKMLEVRRTSVGDNGEKILYHRSVTWIGVARSLRSAPTWLPCSRHPSGGCITQQRAGVTGEGPTSLRAFSRVGAIPHRRKGGLDTGGEFSGVLAQVPMLQVLQRQIVVWR